MQLIREVTDKVDLSALLYSGTKNRGYIVCVLPLKFCNNK